MPDLRLAGTDGEAGRCGALLGPGQIEQLQEAVFDAGMGHRANGLVLVVLDVADPGHAVAALLDDGVAHVLQQGLLVRRPRQRPVARAQGAQRAAQAGVVGRGDAAGPDRPDRIVSRNLWCRHDLCLQPYFSV